MEQDWIEKSLHPVLRLDGEEIDITYWPVAVDHEQGPAITDYQPADVEFKVKCVIPHSLNGQLIYTANDLHFHSRVFVQFAQALKVVLGGESIEASLHPLSSEFVLTIIRDSKIHMNVSIYEWAPPEDGDIVATAGRVVRNPDVLDRWVRDLTSFSRHLDNWILMNRPP